MTSIVATLAHHIRLQDRLRANKGELERLSREVASGTHEDYHRGLGGQANRGMALRASFDQIAAFKESAGVAALQLDAQQAAIAGVKAAGEDVRQVLLSFRSGAENMNPRAVAAGASDALAQARAALDQAVGGRQVFSGPATATASLRPMGEANAAGHSPRSVLDAIRAKQDLGTEAGMRGFLDEARSVFENVHVPGDATEVGWSFDEVFYAGSTAGGMATLLDHGLEVSLDVRANDPAFRTVLEAMTLFSYVPVEATTGESFRVMAEVLSERLTIGIGMATDLTSVVGYREQLVTDTVERHDRTTGLVNNVLADLEGIDDYAAGIRLTALTAQMEAAYTVTARLNRLSLVNYL